MNGAYDAAASADPFDRTVSCLTSLIENLSSTDALRQSHEQVEEIAEGGLWVNPDCGLKTRGWPETRVSLENLVTAARTVREELSSS
jgi:methionine synthase II (cobalamin-independent)